MSSVSLYSGAIIGIEAQPIEVEVDATPGLHFFTIIGLPDKTVEEAKDRIASAVKNSGLSAPKQKSKRIIVSLAPADIKKQGPSYDVPIALGYLLASKQLTFDTQNKIFAGELSLDGRIRPIRGVLALALMTKRLGYSELYIPKENTSEATAINDITVYGCDSFNSLISHLQGVRRLSPAIPTTQKNNESKDTTHHVDFADIKGQESAKRALVISACGNHNMLMFGPPGTGKSLLAKALPSILPPLSHDESIEVTKIHSVAGTIDPGVIIRHSPFRNPHHTTSTTALVGGGTWPQPGEISLAHRGVLFLDELPEFSKHTIDSLRQPLEDGYISVARASQKTTFPARFLFVAALNPCPCGNFGSESLTCICSTQSVLKYRKKISGPMIDRIDILVPVKRATSELLSPIQAIKDSAYYKSLISEVRSRQKAQLSAIGITTNSEIPLKHVERLCPRTESAQAFLKKLVVSHNLSGRSYHRILRLARTIADIANKKLIETPHIAEAANYRLNSESLTNL